jgi:hypothetical protein
LGERGILKLPAHRVGARYHRKILLEAEAVEHVRNRSERHPRLASFDGAQRGSRHAGSLRQERSRKPAPLPSQP